MDVAVLVDADYLFVFMAVGFILAVVCDSESCPTGKFYILKGPLVTLHLLL